MMSKALSRSLKRLFDIIVASAACAILSPLIALIAIAIKLDDRGPVLFVQNRVGRNRRSFRCYKFRTMTPGDQTSDPLQLCADDPRITRIGRLLRLWTLDEIPQLLNVLKGDMSIVGPRPWVQRQARYYASGENRRFTVRPGMAGWAWIHGRNRLPWDERVQLDLWYVDHWSLGLDLRILIRAFVFVLRRDGVYEDAGRRSYDGGIAAVGEESPNRIQSRRSA